MLEDVCIADEIVWSIKASLQKENVQMRSRSARERARLEREPVALRRHTYGAYKEELDGKISKEFWQRNRDEWKTEKLRIKSQI